MFAFGQASVRPTACQNHVQSRFLLTPSSVIFITPEEPNTIFCYVGHLWPESWPNPPFSFLPGLLYEAKGLHEEALKSFETALDVEPNHVPSLISTSIVLKQLSDRSLPVVKSFLTDALRLDRTNPSAWYNLGLLYKAENGSSAADAAECFEAAAVLQESAPVEPFRWSANASWWWLKVGNLLTRHTCIGWLNLSMIDPMGLGGDSK